jgi:hypothetical protein
MDVLLHSAINGACIVMFYHHTNLQDPVLSRCLLINSYDCHIGIILDKDNHFAVNIDMGKWMFSSMLS